MNEELNQSLEHLTTDIEEHSKNCKDNQSNVVNTLNNEPLYESPKHDPFETTIDQNNCVQLNNEIFQQNDSSNLKVFNIVLEKDLDYDEEHKTTEHIYYLPLAIGNSNTSNEVLGKEFLTLTDSTSHSVSDKILYDLGKSLIGIRDDVTNKEDNSKKEMDEPTKLITTSLEENLPSVQIVNTTVTSTNTTVTTTIITTSSVTTNITTNTTSVTTTTTTPTSSPKVDLITVNLLSSDAIPESIAQQFNQIAKLNKSSLSSRRTVRTTSAKLSPLSDSKRQASFEDAHLTEIASVSDSQKNIQKDLLKDTYHARFHSDEIATLQDYVSKPQTQTILDLEYTNLENTDIVHANSSSNTGSSKHRNSNVFRSKSALSTLPPTKRGQRYGHGHQSEPSSQGTDSVHRQSPLLAHENISHSQGQSSGFTASEEGSSSSLPSLDTGGSSSTGGGCSSGHTQTADEDHSIGEELNSANTTILHSISKISKNNNEGDKHSSQLLHSDEAKHLQSDNLSSDKTVLLLSKRRHAVKELIHVEKEYVNALTTLVNMYMIPLKQEKILDDQQVDIIFFKVQELLMYHMSFLNTLQMWELTNTVGDKLLDMFSREAVAMCYCTFVDNFSNSEKTLETCWNTKSSFQKFCEMKLRMNRNKLPLKALLVQPIQRIPRYELLIKRLLESTPKDYSDHALLVEAESAIHRLALRVNAVHTAGEDENIVDGIRLIEKLLAPATLTPTRQYVRHDIVSVEERKDPVCIFMFTDQIVFTVARRRGSQVIKKPVFLRLQSIRGVDAIENIKYKIYHRLGIEAIELESRLEVDIEPTGQHKEVKDKKDLALLAEIENISARLDFRHYDLDAVVRRMYMSIQKELEDLRTARNTSTPMPGNMSIFTATSKEGVERYELMFPNSAKRKEWERTILELKRQLSSVKRMAKFNEAVQIPRTLPGIQLSCASMIESSPLVAETPCDVWICASDGYTGYVCLLTVHPKPNIYFNVPLSGCTSRITCICAIPGYIHPGLRRTSHSLIAQSMRSRYGMEKKRSATMDQPLLEVEQQVTEENNCQSKLHAAVSEKPSLMNTNEKVVDSKVVDKVELNTNSDGSKNAENTFDDDVRCRKSSIPQDTSTSSHSTTPPDTPTNTESTLKLSDGDESKGDDVSNLPKKCDISPESGEINVQQNNELITQKNCEESDSLEKNKNEPQREISLDIYAEYTDDQDDPTSNDSDSSDISETEGDLTQHIISENLSDNSLFKETEHNIQSYEYDSKTDEYTNSHGKNHCLTSSTQPLMWLGTEEGSIFMFYASDNLKTSRQRQKISLSHGINNILHFDVHIFVACANGDLIVYKRNSDGLWDVNKPIHVKLQPNSNEPVIVKRMLVVAGKIWCAAHRSIFILNPTTLTPELSFPLNGNYADPRGIQLMAYGKQTVWLATENSSRISLYHATTGEFLMEIDLKPIVLQRLQDCDEIIMRHKEACLRITCLTVCKDLLWAGTSAGVIVTVAIPKLGTGPTYENIKQPQLETLSYGHIGQVRFLVTLDNIADDENPIKSKTEKTNTSSQAIYISNSAITPFSDKVTSSDGNEANTSSHLVSSSRTSDLSQSGQLSRHHFSGSRRSSINPCTTINTKMKVISGGEGREEFSKKDLTTLGIYDNNLCCTIGDDDSDNYVLIWDVK
uniref:DH domain-containing protein n=1 Tax=Schistosoma mansoni TaxID=6183 RepID=A0A5K4EV64_SCHMA